MRRLAGVATALVVVLLSSPALGATKSWTNNSGTGDGLWTTASNWFPSGVPTSADDVQIGTDQVAGNVKLTASTTVNSVTITDPYLASPVLEIANGATLTIAAASSVGSGGTLYLNNGSLSGSGNLTVTGTLNWASGWVMGAATLTVGSGGVVEMSTPSSKILETRTLANSGTVNLSGTGTFYLANGAVVDNQPGALFHTTSDAGIHFYTGAAATFTNAGTLRKSTATGTTSLSGNITFSNSGTIDLQSGTLRFDGGGTNSGTLSSAAGTTLLVATATFTLNSGTTVTGAGTFRVAGGTVTIPTGVTTEIPTLAFDSGTINGGGTLSSGPTGTISWSGGSMSGGGTTVIPAGGTLELLSASSRFLDARTLDNSGTVNLSGTGTLYLANGAVVSNRPGALFHTTSDAGIYFYTGAVGTFTNAGTLRKSTATGTTILSGNITFSNSGTIDLQSGTIRFDGGGTNSGTLNSAAGTTLRFPAATFTLASGTTLTGAGAFRVAGGTVTIPTGVTIEIPTLVFDSGTINGGGTLSSGPTGTITWSSGSMSGGGTTVIPVGGTLDLVSASSRFLDARTLDNSGTVNLSGTGTLYLANGAVVSNQPGALFHTTSDAGIYFYTGAVGTFTNAGTLRKSTATGTTILSGNITFSNSGTIDLQSGTIRFDAGGTNTGTLSSAAGTTLLFQTATFTLDAGTTLSLAGTFRIAGATLTIPTGLTIEIPTLAFDWGTINGGGTLSSGTGTITWSSGSMTGGGTTVIPTGGTLEVLSTSSRFLDARTLDNSGTVNFSGTGTLYLANGAIVNNQPGALFHATSDAGVYHYTGAVGTFTNGGTFRKSVATGTTILSGNVTFTSSGTIDVQSGTLRFDGGGTHSGTATVATGAVLQLQAGSHSFDAASSVNVSGTIWFSGGTATVAGSYSAPGTTKVAGGTVTFEASITPEIVDISSGTAAFNAAASVGQFQMSGGTLTGSGTVTIAGTATAHTWTGGLMTGAGTTLVGTGATLAITNAGYTYLTTGRTLQNDGSIAYGTVANTNAHPYLHIYNDGSTLNNNGTFDLVSNQAIHSNGTFNNNAGATLKKSGGTAASPLYVNVINAGSIEVASGALELHFGSTHSGSLTIATGATLRFGNGTHAVQSTTSITSPGTVAFSAGTTTIDAAFTTDLIQITNGTANFNATTGASRFQMSNGTLGGGGAVTVSGTATPHTWSGGTMTGAGATIFATGTALTISSTGYTYLTGGRTLTNNGAITYGDAANTNGWPYLHIYNDGSTFNNNGTFTLVNDQPVHSGGTFNNSSSASLTKSGGTGTSLLYVKVNNAGSVAVSSGALGLQSGGTHSGPFSVAAGTTLQFGSGTHAVGSGSSITSSGTVAFTGSTTTVDAPYTTSGVTTTRVTGGTVTFNTAVSNDLIEITNGTVNFNVTTSTSKFQMTNGTIGGTGTVTVSGTATPHIWSGGMMTGTGTTVFATGTTLTISSTGYTYVTGGRTLTNNGTITYGEAANTNAWPYLHIYNDGSILNNNGTFELVSDQPIHSNGTFNNNGTLTKSGGTATTHLYARLNNAGSVAVSSGTLALNWGGTHSGAFTVASGTTLHFGSGTHALQAASSIASSGTLAFTSGASTIDGTYTTSGTTTTRVVSGSATFNTVVDTTLLEITGGTATFNAATSASEFSMSNGTLTGTGTVTISGTTTPHTWSAGSMTGSGATIFETGTTLSIPTTGYTYVTSGRTLTNRGTIEYGSTTNTNYYPYLHIYNDGSKILNEGTFELVGDQSIVSGGTISNSGTFRKSGGTGTSALSVAVSNSGDVRSVAGTIAFNSGFTQIAGVLSLEGGNVSSTSTMNVQGGAVAGSGTISANLTNAGTLRPGDTGAAGTLAITGTYSQSAGGAIDVELASDTSFDKVTIGTSSSLGGTLNVSYLSGYAPANGALFEIQTFASRTGDFATTNGLTYPTGTLSYSAGTTSIILAASSEADLSLAKSASTANVPTGGTFSYSVEVTNAGPHSAGTVTVTDALPAGVTLDSLSASGWTCSGTTTVSCSMSILPVGTSTITMFVTAPSTTGTITNTASSTAANDPNATNDTSNAVTTNVVTPASTRVVTSNADSGADTLRQAILDANSGACAPSPCTITFNLATPSIAVASPLPAAQQPVIIDASTNPTGMVELAGGPLNFVTFDGLILGGGNSTIRGLAIHGFPTAGIRLTGATGSNAIEGNYIGLTSAGTASPNGSGIVVENSDNIIGGSSAVARNVVSGNSGDGVYVTIGGGNTIAGNYIGIGANGSTAAGNGAVGIRVFQSSGNTIGGPAAADGNVISGNTDAGVLIYGSTNQIATSQSADISATAAISSISQQNVVQNNLIGTNAAGTSAVPNAGGAVTITGSAVANVVIENTISGSSVPIDLLADGLANPNDTGDADTGPNNLQNYPQVHTVTLFGSTVEVTLSLDSSAPAPSHVRIDVYESDQAGQPQDGVGSQCIATTAGTLSNYALTLPAGTLLAGDSIVATATAYTDGCTTPGDGTSEVSPVAQVSACNAPSVSVSGPASFCAGGSATLTAVVSGGTGTYTSYQWFRNQVAINGATTSSYVATAAGDYAVHVTDDAGCTGASAPLTLSVNANPAVTISTADPTTFCDGNSATLTSSATTGNQWRKDGVDINGATAQTFVASVAGNYTVFVTDGNGCSAESNVISVNVNTAPPAPTIAASGLTTFCSGESVTLTSSATTGNQWKKDGAVINGATAQTFAATEQGNYSVVFTETNGCFAESAPIAVTVNPAPPAPTIAASGPTTFCEGGSVTLTSSATSGNQWMKDGAAINGATSQTFVAGATGNYTVVFTDANGCFAESAPVAVTTDAAPPTPTITPSGPTNVCDGGSVTLTSSATTGNQWMKDGTVLNGATAQTFVADATGNYSVVVTGSNGCSAESAPIAVSINAAPATPTITPSGPTTFCDGGSVTLTSSATSGNQWMKDGTAIDAATGQTFVATATGNYAVLFTDENGCVAESAPIAVTATAAPATPTIAPSGPTTFCDGGSVTLTSSATTGNQWMKDGAIISNATGQTLIATATGNYSVIVTDANSCFAESAPIAVTVNPVPAAPTITPSGPTTFCDGGSVTLTSSATAGNQWIKDGAAIAGATAQTFVASAPGNYSVIHTANGCFAESAPIGVTTTPAPAAPTIAPSGPTSFCEGGSVVLTSSDASSYQWARDGQPISNANARTYTAMIGGTYTVTTINDCQATSAPVTVTVKPLPNADVSVAPIIGAGATGEASVAVQANATYSWSISGGTIVSGADAPTLTFIAGSGPSVHITAVVTIGGCSMSGSFTISVTSSSIAADLSIVKSAPATVEPGGTISYSIDVANAGPHTASNVVVTDQLPAGTTFSSASGMSCAHANGVVTCTAAQLAPGNTAITIVTTAPPSGTLTNVVTISSSTDDPVPSNNSSSVTTTVNETPATDPCAGRAAAAPLSPGNGTTVHSSSVELSWNPAPNADEYRVWASIDGAPAAVLGTTADTSLATTIVSGDVIWWVEALYEGCASTESQRFRFTIPAATECGTAKPEMLSPANETVSGGSVTFTWSSVPGAISYELWVALANGTPAVVGSTSSTTMTHTVPAGTIEWFVRAIVDRCPPRDSDPVRFTYAPPAGCAALRLPTPAIPYDRDLVTSPVAFRWDAVEGATRYQLFIRRGNHPPLVFESASNRLDAVPLSFHGHARWFVRAYGGDCVVESSEQSMQVVPRPAACTTLGVPVVAAPGEISSDIPFRVQWSSVPGATMYELQVSGNAAFEGAQTLTSETTEHELVRTNDGNEPFAVYARVRAIDARCQPVPTVGAYSPTAAVFILPPHSPTGSATADATGIVTYAIGLGPELAGQSFTAVVNQPFLTVAPPSGVVPTGGITLTVTADVSTLPLGATLGAVTITLSTPPASGSVGGHGTTSVTKTVSVSLVTPVTPTTKSTPPPDALIIPAVAHADGINSKFQSDVRVSNTSPRLIKYQLTFTPSGDTGMSSGRQTTFSIEPGRTIALDDVLKSWFGTGGASVTGTLEIRPLTQTTSTTSALAGLVDLSTFASSRTFNVTSNGTFGQHVPAIPFANFVGRALEGAKSSVLSLQQIAHSSRYRTNLGLVEGSGEPASLLVKVFGDGGQKLTEFVVKLAGGQHTQLNGFLAQHGISSLSDGRVEVEVTSPGGKVTAYASVLDNATSDPLLVTPVTLTDAGSTRWVMPGVADLDNGFANWQTDMRVFNAGTEDVDATLLFYSQTGGEPRTATLTIPAGKVRQLDKTLPSIFGVSNDGGAVHITTPAESRLVATARTYNQTTGGTYGQFVSAVTPAEAVGVGSRPLQILQVEESDRFRSNIGLAEVTGNPVKVEISVVPPDAKFTVVAQVDLAANEFRQIGSLLRSVGLANTYNARVTVRAIDGKGRVTAYASVIDSQTNDPTYVPAQ